MRALSRQVLFVEQRRPMSSVRANERSAVILIFDLFAVWKSKLGGMPRIFRAEQQKIKIRNSRTARAGELDCLSSFENQVSPESLGFIQVGNQVGNERLL